MKSFPTSSSKFISLPSTFRISSASPSSLLPTPRELASSHILSRSAHYPIDNLRDLRPPPPPPPPPPHHHNRLFAPAGNYLFNHIFSVSLSTGPHTRTGENIEDYTAPGNFLHHARTAIAEPRTYRSGFVTRESPLPLPRRRRKKFLPAFLTSPRESLRCASSAALTRRFIPLPEGGIWRSQGW